MHSLGKIKQALAASDGEKGAGARVCTSTAGPVRPRADRWPDEFDGDCGSV